jgi:hypothetical protein
MGQSSGRVAATDPEWSTGRRSSTGELSRTVGPNVVDSGDRTVPSGLVAVCRLTDYFA